MTHLAWTYGRSGEDPAEPLISWAGEFVGRPVRIRVIEPVSDYWLRGCLVSVGVPDEDILCDEQSVVLTVVDGDRETHVPIAVAFGGTLVWSCPRHLVLCVIGNDGLRHEIHDDRRIRMIDSVERDLARALLDPDPTTRHNRLAAMCELSEQVADSDPGDEMRTRLVALSVFLEEYSEA